MNMHDATLLLQSDAARREIGQAAREAIERAMDEHGEDVRKLYALLADQRGILTLARTADLLGVTERTVTERYVKRGMPCVRLSAKGSPLFLLEDVVNWLREADVSRKDSGRSPAQRGTSSPVDAGAKKAEW